MAWVRNEGNIDASFPKADFKPIRACTRHNHGCQSGHQQGLRSRGIFISSDDVRRDVELQLFQILFVETVILPMVIVLKSNGLGVRRATDKKKKESRYQPSSTSLSAYQACRRADKGNHEIETVVYIWR